MVEVYLRKRFGALRPSDKAAEEWFASVPDGETLKAFIKRPRNVRMHNLYFALVGLVYDNLPEGRYQTFEQFHTALKVALGHCDTVICRDGSVAYIPKSISFAKMGQDEFAAFFDNVIAMVIKHFLPGVSDAELRREVESMVGIAA